jgi:hypothetical protein
VTIGADPIAAYLDSLRRDRRLPRRRRRRVVAEIEAHLRDLAAEAEARGLPPAEAAAWAVSQFGEGQLVADQLAELHHHRGRRASQLLAVSVSVAGMVLAATAGLLGVRDGHPLTQLPSAQAAFIHSPTLAKIATTPAYWSCQNLKEPGEMVNPGFAGPVGCTVTVQFQQVRSQRGTVFEQMLKVFEFVFSSANRRRLTVRVFGPLASGGVQAGNPNGGVYPHYGQQLAVRCLQSKLPAAAVRSLTVSDLRRYCTIATTPKALSGPQRKQLPGGRVVLRLLHWPKTVFVSAGAGCSEISAVFSVNRTVVASLLEWPDPAPPPLTAGTHVVSTCVYPGDFAIDGAVPVIRVVAVASPPGGPTQPPDAVGMAAGISLVYRVAPYPANQAHPTSWRATYVRMVSWCIRAPGCPTNPPSVR